MKSEYFSEDFDLSLKLLAPVLDEYYTSQTANISL